MKIININQNIRCDSLMCNKNASYKIELNTYKDDLHLCQNFYKNLKLLFKKDVQNESKQK